MLARALFLVHLLGFAAFLGAAFAQLQFMKRSGQSGVSAPVRDEYERLCAATITKIELPALFAQVGSGVVSLVLTPGWLKMGWIHGKLTAVLLLLVLSHLEMFNARAIVKARATRGDAAEADIAARKARHMKFGSVGTLLVAAILVLVTIGLR